MKNLCARCVKRNAYDLFLKAYGGDKPRTADRAAQTSAERQAQHPRPRSRSTSSLHANGGPVLGRRPNVRISGQVRSGLHANGGPVLGRRRNVRISQLLFSYGKLYNGQPCMPHWAACFRHRGKNIVKLLPVCINACRTPQSQADTNSSIDCSHKAGLRIATFCQLSHRFHLANSSIFVTHVFVLLPEYSFRPTIGWKVRKIAHQFPMMTQRSLPP